MNLYLISKSIQKLGKAGMLDTDASVEQSQ
jgi:hypothetical protein